MLPGWYEPHAAQTPAAGHLRFPTLQAHAAQPLEADLQPARSQKHAQQQHKPKSEHLLQDVWKRLNSNAS